MFPLSRVPFWVPVFVSDRKSDRTNTNGLPMRNKQAAKASI